VVHRRREASRTPSPARPRSPWTRRIALVYPLAAWCARA
jgi:hypothetical protein